MQKTIWDYLFYFSMSVLTVWLILKVAGIINTPVWLEYGVPIGSFIVGFVTFFQSLSDKFTRLQMNDVRMDEKLTHLDRDIERIKDDVISMRSALKN